MQDASLFSSFKSREVVVPLFPLPNVVLFPGALLPLHIFEERYRQMIKDALTGQRVIGMVLLQRGWEKNYEGSPSVFTVGCAGEIVQEESLAEGRFNIVLHGISRFQLTREVSRGTLYRQGCIALLDNVAREEEKEPLEALRRKVLSLCTEILMEMKMTEILPYASSLTAAQLFDTAAFYLNMPVEKKQELLSELDLLKRGESLLSLLRERVTLMRYLKQNKDSFPQSPMMN